MTLGPGIEPGTHWWEASALTTAPSLLPYLPLQLLIHEQRFKYSQTKAKVHNVKKNTKRGGKI